MFGRMFGGLFSMSGRDAGKARIRLADAAEVLAWLQAGEAVIVDVREGDEFAAGHIPGAASMPLSRFEPARVPRPQDKKLVVHCASGVRCGTAATRLAAAGYEGVIYRMTGGLKAWARIGGPLEPGR